MEKWKDDSNSESAGDKETVKTNIDAMAKELHKPAYKVQDFRPVAVRSIDDTWCIDLVDMTIFAKDNDGYKFLLTCIDVLSRYAWAIPMKNKSAATTLTAFKSIVDGSGRHPNKIWADNGNEFFNRQFKRYLHSLPFHNAEPGEAVSEYKEEEKAKEPTERLYFTHNTFHAAPVERFNRTLKTMMWYKFTKNELKNKSAPHRWIDRIKKLLNKYNNTIISTTGMTPEKASLADNEPLLMKLQQAKLNRHDGKAKFQLGDRVRLSKLKERFEKGYTQNWTKEIFTVCGVIHSKPPMYKVEDNNGEEIIGSYYGEELMKTKF